MGDVMDGYIRVSNVGGRAGDRFQSPGQQRETIAAWAVAHGVQIGEWHEDLDRSGGTMDRPGMNRAIARVESGHSSGIVVARLDRFARTLIGGLTTIETLNARGARVVSVHESIDPATPMGKAMIGLLLIMAAWQRDQASEHLIAAQHRAASAGRFPGRVPYGYRKTAEGKTEVDPDTGPVLQRIMRERAAGDGWRLIADRLSRDGVPTARGRDRWAPTTVLGIVRSEASLGVFTGPHGLRVEDAWPVLVDRGLWDRANARTGVRDGSRHYEDRLLAGIARCAFCRGVLKRASNPEGFVSYSCRTPGCTERASLGAVLLDEHVSDLIDGRLQRAALSPGPASDEGEGARLLTARDVAVRELEAWRDDLGLRAALGDRDWREGIMGRAAARDAAEVDLEQHRSRGGLRALDALPGTVVPRLAEFEWGVRREVAEALLHAVWVRRSVVRGVGARRHVGSRLLVSWRDDPSRPGLPARYGDALGPVRW